MEVSHVVPIWFVLDYRNNEDNLGNMYFTTFIGSVKAENIQRDNRISMCIDDQTPPFSFVTIHGTAKLYPYKQKEVLKWATRIAERYIGKKDSKAYGERNSGEGASTCANKTYKNNCRKRYNCLGMRIRITIFNYSINNYSISIIQLFVT